MAITNKEILEEIEFLKTKLPNGEFALLKKSVEDLSGGQEALKSSIRELKQQLLDPVINRRFAQAYLTGIFNTYRSILHSQDADISPDQKLHFAHLLIV